jgi:hypothetical protein
MQRKQDGEERRRERLARSGRAAPEDRRIRAIRAEGIEQDGGTGMKKEQPQPIPLEIDEKAAEGVYSNFVLTAHTASEFIIDFARMLPGVKKAKVSSRIVMTPQTAKSLHMVLSRTIEKYESTFGEIKLPGARQAVPAIGFQTNLPGEEEKKH